MFLRKCGFKENEFDLTELFENVMSVKNDDSENKEINQFINEKIEFKNNLKIILDKIFSETKDSELRTVFENIRDVYEYNVINGKLNRGMILIITFKFLSENSRKDISSAEKENCYILGWLVEILQAFALILDDIMDDSTTRRGQLCWYKKVGMSAINDALLLEQHCYEIMRIFFSGKSYYMNIMETFHQISLITVYGQKMDLKSITSKNVERFKDFTELHLKAIYKYKTSYYTFVLPFKLGMILSSYELKETDEAYEKFILKIGHLFQMEDDFLDCFGDHKLTGKLGTDIADGKCCWPIVKAIKFGDSRQLSLLKQNYGIKSEININIVKQVYKELKLISIYKIESNDMKTALLSEIQNLKKSTPNDNPFPKIYDYILSQICKINNEN